MRSLSDMAKALNRSPVYLRGVQSRFALPLFEGAGYSDAYLAFLRTVVQLRTLGVGEVALLKLWELEKKLLQLLHLDTTGSTTWFLDACGQSTYRHRRLLLSNQDMGVDISRKSLQPGLDFSARMPELFEGKVMGEDAMRVLESYLSHLAHVRTEVTTELLHVRGAATWAKQFISGR